MDTGEHLSIYHVPPWGFSPKLVASNADHEPLEGHQHAFHSTQLKEINRINGSSRELLLSLINKIRILPFIFFALATHEARHKSVPQHIQSQRKRILNKIWAPLEFANCQFNRKPIFPSLPWLFWRTRPYCLLVNSKNINPLSRVYWIMTLHLNCK